MFQVCVQAHFDAAHFIRNRVEQNEMVDMEDILAQDWIYSEDMLHFFVEHFEMDLEWQSLLLEKLINVRVIPQTHVFIGQL